MNEKAYEIREAVRILSRARAVVDAGDLKSEREQAAKDLLEAVFAAAVAAGFERSDDGRGGQFLQGTSGGDVLALQSGRDGIRMLLLDDGGRTKHALSPAAIEYDPAEKMWVGTEPDTAVTPRPGELVPMRSAAAAVALRIAEAFAQPQP
jgi:hypothetical protein